MVYHILADGTVTTDITGKVVKLEDARPLYDLMLNTRVTKRRGEKNDKSE